ncbi:MAG: hypothetical protein ABIK44_03615, partial [candidate division WOR-3 bacterium]
MLKAVKAAGLLLLVAAFALAVTPEEEAAALAHKGMREPPVSVTGKPVPPGFAPVNEQWSSGGPIWETDAQWDPEVRLTNNSFTDYTSYNGKNVVVDPAGRIHVVWYSYQTPGSYTPQIYYKRYIPGTGWTSDTCISADVASSRYCYYPSIACDSAGNIHVVWRAYYSTTYEIRYKMCTPTSSGNGGWEAASTVISTSPTTWYKYYPDVACTPDNHVHVVWNQYYSTAGYMITYREKIGTTWQTQVMVDSSSTSYYKGYPSVGGSRNNNVHVAWYGLALGISYYQIFYRGRISGVWGSIENVSNGIYYQYYPSVACNPVTNNPHIVWYGYDASFSYYKIIHSYRTSSGWQPRDTVSEWPQYTYYQYNPEMEFTSDGKGHVVWYGYSAAQASYYQIRYNERSPAGVWGTPINLTNVTGSYRYYPSIANGGNSSNRDHLHVVWTDSRDGNYEIYYKHGAPPPPYDVGVSKIVVPNGIYEDQLLQPSAYVKNYGVNTVTSFSVKMDIGTSYTSTVAWNGSLASGDSVLINTFATWDPPAAGEYPVKCSTMMSSDGNPSNDRKNAQCVIANFVEYFEPTDCGYTQSSSGSNWFWRPPAAPRPAPPSPPNVWTCPDSDYYQNNTAANLYSVTYFAVQDTPRIIFFWWMYSETYWDGGNFAYSTDNGQNWTILEPDTTGGRSLPYYGTLSSGERGWSGSYGWNIAWFKIPVASGTAFKCRWRFTSDASVTYVGGMMVDNVAGMGCRKPIDVAAVEILAPVGNIPYGTPVTPQAKVKNLGTGTQSFNVKFDIGTFYSDTQWVSNLGAGDSVTVNFDQWGADTAGTWVTACSTMLATDDIPGNDRCENEVTVNLIDVLPTQIVSPGAVVDSGATITPRARFKNRGNNPASFYATFRILEVGYSNTRLLVNIPSGKETLVSFNNWTVPGRGTYTLRCSTRLTGDQVPENDTLSGQTTGRVLDVATTAILQPGAMVYINDVVTPQATVWNYGSEPAVFNLRFVIMDATDAVVYDTTEEVSLDVGATEDHLFTKTWVASPAGAYVCYAKASLPGDVIPANDSTSKPFRVSLRYTPGWKEMKPMPSAPSGKEVKDGGWLAFDPGSDGKLIYAAKGNKTPDFYRYHVDGDSWQTLAPIKPGTENKLPKKGCVGVADGQGHIYMTKGNNTLGFWEYFVEGDSWVQLLDVPLGNSGKKVKGGTDMVYAVLNDTGYVYLLKGYKCDFFRYNTVTGQWQTL